MDGKNDPLGGIGVYEKLARASYAGNGRAAGNDNRASDVKLDQYYTAEQVARRLYGSFSARIDPAEFLMFEPSAGTGAFFKILSAGSRGCDLDPRWAGIDTADFLDVVIGGGRPIAIIGNPPFSRGMARKFFNHAAQQAQVIALILPRSFRKTSVKNKLDRNFHLIHAEDVEQDAFLFRGNPLHVQAVFQIWVRRAMERKLLIEPKVHADFDFLSTSDGADFAIQRVGNAAGRIHDELWKSGKAHYFVRANRPGVRAALEQLDFSGVTGDVAGKPSLAKTELVSLYSDLIQQLEARSAGATSSLA